MTAIAVFLHATLLLVLGPPLAGLIRMITRGGGLAAFLEPTLSINSGLRARNYPPPHPPPLGPIAALALAFVAGLLIPLFSPDAVLGFLGDGFVALLLLVGLSARYFTLRASSVLAVATALWAIGTLTGSTDLGQALANWQLGLAPLAVFLALAAGVAPFMTPETPEEPGSSASGSNDALTSWARSTAQVGWLALGAMAFPWTIPLTGGAALAASLAFFVVKIGLLAGFLAFANARWPKLPLAESGFAMALLALALVKLGI